MMCSQYYRGVDLALWHHSWCQSKLAIVASNMKFLVPGLGS